MARLSREDVKKWQSRLELSENWRKPYKEKWDRFKDYLEGLYFEAPKDDEDQIAVNLVFPMVRVIIPSIYSRNPDVLVSARRPEFQANTTAMSQFLKYMVKEMDLKEEVKLALLDTLICGHGWVKLGFESEFQDQEETSSIAKLLKSMFGGAEEEENDYELRPNEKLVAERPWALRVSYEDIFVPAFTKNHKTMPWIAERSVVPLQDVKDNPRFKNTRDLKPSSNIKEYLRDKTGVGNLDPTDTEYCALYEIHDGREGKIYTLAEDNELPLEEKDTEYTMLNQRYPYFMLRFNEVPDTFYPQSDVEAWEPQIHELNKIRTQQSIHRKRFNRRYLYRTGAISDEALDDLKNGEDGTLVGTEEETLENVIKPIEDATLSPDSYATESRIKDDITEIGGITGYQRGSLSQGAKTATEASIVEGQSRSRSDERVDGVNSFVIRLVRGIAQVSQALMTQEDVYPILGDELTPSWVTLGPEDIKGEFLYDVVFGSSLPINKEVDRQQYLQLYEMISADPNYDVVKPRLELLRKFDVRDPEKWLNQMLMGPAMEGQPPLPPPPPGGPGVEQAPPLASPPTTGVPSPASIRASIGKQIGTPQPGGVGGKLV